LLFAILEKNGNKNKENRNLKDHAMIKLQHLLLFLMIIFCFNLVAQESLSQDPEVAVIAGEVNIESWDDLVFDIDDESFTLEDIENIPTSELTLKDYFSLFTQGVKYKTEKTKEHIIDHKKKYIFGLLSGTLMATGFYLLLNKRKKSHDKEPSP